MSYKDEIFGFDRKMYEFCIYFESMVCEMEIKFYIVFYVFIEFKMV